MSSLLCSSEVEPELGEERGCQLSAFGLGLHSWALVLTPNLDDSLSLPSLGHWWLHSEFRCQTRDSSVTLLLRPTLQAPFQGDLWV